MITETEKVTEGKFIDTVMTVCHHERTHQGDEYRRELPCPPMYSVWEGYYTAIKDWVGYVNEWHGLPLTMGRSCIYRYREHDYLLDFQNRREGETRPVDFSDGDEIATRLLEPLARRGVFDNRRITEILLAPWLYMELSSSRKFKLCPPNNSWIINELTYSIGAYTFVFVMSSKVKGWKLVDSTESK